MSSSGEQFFSGGADGDIYSWNTPSASTDPYDPYESSVLRGALSGHSDAVWGVAYSSAHQRLISCSADETMRVWDAADTKPALTDFCCAGVSELGVPSSLDLLSSDQSLMVCSFSSGNICIFSLETHQLLLRLDSEPGAERGINQVLSHPTMPLTISAEEDRHIRFYDNNTGKLVHSMVAHLDSVTCLSVDPHGLHLMSGSHDCSVRLWSLDSRTCVQEFTAHRRKLSESIHAVSFHRSLGYLCSGGADALAKVYV
uniref:Striatin n=1 Tax=Neogobius melanostomus TaxID=47308 RepID=A0A8C6TF75_9GOBI